MAQLPRVGTQRSGLVIRNENATSAITPAYFAPGAPVALAVLARPATGFRVVPDQAFLAGFSLTLPPLDV
jgi:hypothetical protein